MLSSSPLPEVSELDIAGGLRGEPIDVVRGPYTGFPIPADCEIVIEGETVPGPEQAGRPVRRMDGLLLRRHPGSPLRQRQDRPLSQQPDPDLRAAAQAGRRDRPAQGHRRRGANLAPRSTIAAFPKCSASGTTRPARRRASPRSRSSSAIPATRARRCTSPAHARAAPMPASGRWWSTTTSARRRSRSGAVGDVHAVQIAIKTVRMTVSCAARPNVGSNYY